MKQIIVALVVGGITAGQAAYGEHDKACKNVHGKVTVVTDSGVTVNDQFYKVGASTQIVKGTEIVKLDKVSAGDVVCLDPRGKDDIATRGEVASVTVLGAKDPSGPPDKEVVREKVIREKEKIREEH